MTLWLVVTGMTCSSPPTDSAGPDTSVADDSTAPTDTVDTGRAPDSGSPDTVDTAGRADSAGDTEVVDTAPADTAPPHVSAELTTDDAHRLVTGLSAGDGLGRSLAWVGDSDGDGLPELAVHASPEDVTWVLTPDGLTEQSLVDANARYVFDEHSQQNALAAIDLDCDGLDDLALGSPGTDETYDAYSYGAVLVEQAPLDRFVDLPSDPWVAFLGEGMKDMMGEQPANLGDLDGDGCDDLGFASGSGEMAYIVDGPVTATGWIQMPGDHVKMIDERGGYPRQLAGGDLDGDGYGDVAMTWQDTLFALSGPITHTLNLGSRADAEILGDEGDAVVSADWDGDGYDDVLTGYATGHAKLYLGPLTSGLSASQAVLQLTGSNDFGDDVALLPADGGDVGVVAVSAPRSDAVYVWRDLVSGSVDDGDADLVLSAVSASSYIGYGIVFADVDLDGAEDLLVTVSGHDSYTGAVYAWTAGAMGI